MKAFEREGADRLILLGDVLYHGPRNDLPEEYAPKKVIEMLNPLAQKIINECFVPRRDLWRGLGAIDASGLALRDELAEFDAEKKFAVEYGEGRLSPCRCGDVICGRIAPQECPMFGARCTPEDPVGPCMVSSEGACAAAYKYQSI